MVEPDVAVALRYAPERQEVPRVVAKGRGSVAAQMVALAEAHGVPVRGDADLAALLAAIELDSPIPVAAFAAVAAILAELYRANDAAAPAGGGTAEGLP